MAYKDGQNIRGAGSGVANTEASIGTISVPAGISWKLTDIWCGSAGAGGGVYRLRISTYPQAEFSWIQEGLTDVSVAVATANTTPTPMDTVIVGPADLEAFVSNVVAGVNSSVQINYMATGGPSN